MHDLWSLACSATPSLGRLLGSVVVLLSMQPGHVAGQTPVAVGPELEVSSTLQDVEGKVRSAADANGDFVVVWEALAFDGSNSYEVFGRRFRFDGAPLGDNFLVNAYTTGIQVFPDIVMQPSGEFVVIWQSYLHGGNGIDVFARRFNADAVPLTDDLAVHLDTTGDQHDPAVTSTVDGGFLVIWDHDTTSEHAIQAQPFDSLGNRVGSVLEISNPGDADDFDPRVSKRPDDSFVALWERTGDGTSGDGSGKAVFALLLESDGSPDGAEFQVNDFTRSDQENPEVAVTSDGSFAVTWQSQSLDGSGNAVVMRLFHSNGSFRTGDLQVNATTENDQIHPMILAVEDDGFVVVWESETGLAPQGKDALGRRFDSQGQALSGEFQVNQVGDGNQTYVDVAAVSSDRFIVSWSSNDCDGCDQEVEARLFYLSSLFVDGFESGDVLGWSSSQP